MIFKDILEICLFFMLWLRISSGCSMSVEWSATTDQGRLITGVFSAADKGSYV